MANPSAQRTPQERLMAEAIAEARRAEGRTRPNPMVGCVLVRDGEIVARGHHARAGEPHGEIAALEALDGPSEGLELYVNLEPCCHHGRTPPCTEAIIDAGIERVYIGTLDPYPKVRGRGKAALEAAGVEVVSGVLAEECHRLNQPYFKRITTGMPWVAVKYAMTLDGKIATSTGDSAWISSGAARRRVHRLRDTFDAIMVGTGTLRDDNPRLTCRIEGGRDPVRVVLDAALEASVDSNVFDPSLSDAPTIAVVGAEAPEGRRQLLQERGVDLLEVEADRAGRLDLEAILEGLSEREILSVLVEGGGRLLGSFFDEQLVDEAYVFVSPKIVGGQEAPTPVAGRGCERMEEAVELDSLRLDLIEGREAYFRGVVPERHRKFVESTPAIEAPAAAAQEV